MTDFIPQIDKSCTSPVLVAVDIGNSGIKLGRFARATDTGEFGDQLPVPSATLEIPIEHATGAFDARNFRNGAKRMPARIRSGPLAASHRGAASAGRYDRFVGTSVEVRMADSSD